MSEKIEGIVLDCIRFKENSVIAGINFWAFGGFAKPANSFE